MPLARRPRLRRRGLAAVTALAVPALVVGSASIASAASARPSVPASGGWHERTLAAHPTIPLNGGSFALSAPDDIQQHGDRLFVAFQNGVGPEGQPAANGTTFSTLADFTRSGRMVAHWNLVGKIDGVGRDGDRIVATVNEDGNTSIYTVTPSAPAGRQVAHDTYRPANPLPSGGGTDDVEMYRGHVFASASAPGTVPSAVHRAAHRPAVYEVTFRPGSKAVLRPFFYDGSHAVVANTTAPRLTPASPKPAWGTVPAGGTRVRLALTDPDSTAVVPYSSPRFGGSFVLDSQADQQLIFARPDVGGPRLSVLDLGQSIDDFAWATRSGGTYYVTDSATDSLVAVTGGVHAGEVVVSATPGDALDAGTASNYLGILDLRTGTVRGIPGLGGLKSGGLVYVAR